jgi:hypothetical protein
VNRAITATIVEAAKDANIKDRKTNELAWVAVHDRRHEASVDVAVDDVQTVRAA